MSKEQPKRLGRGLAALLGDAAAPSTVTAPGVQNLAVDLLEPSPFQPRRKMDEGALDELSASIGQRGILQPLLVRPHPAVAGRYQIIAGERRWRAAQKVPLHEVPVLVRPLSDTDAMAAGLVENLQREDLNAVEEAQGYDRLLNEFEMTQEMLGEAIGKSRAHIGNMLRLLKLPDSVLEMVRTGELSFGHARAIMGQMSPLALARDIIKKNLTVRQTETYVERAGRSIDPKILKKPPPARRYYDADLEAVQQQLIDRLGLDVDVTYTGKKGAVTIRYQSLEQLDTLLALLNG